MIAFSNLLWIYPQTKSILIFPKSGEPFRATREVLVVSFGYGNTYTVPLIVDKNSGELCVKYSKKTNAFKLIKWLMKEKVGIRNLNEVRWYKALRIKESNLSSVELFKDLIFALWYDNVKNRVESRFRKDKNV